jgi:hypothetical protein
VPPKRRKQPERYATFGQNFRKNLKNLDKKCLNMDNAFYDGG